MSDIAEGVSIEFFETNPPMLFYGQIDGWWYALYWWERDWMFLADMKKETVLYWILNNKIEVKFGKASQHGLPWAWRPTTTPEIKAGVRAIIVECAKEFRQSIGPREWSPRWPVVKGREKG